MRFHDELHVSLREDWSVWHISGTGELVSRSVYFHRTTVGPFEDRLGTGPPWQTWEPLARDRCSKVTCLARRLAFEERAEQPLPHATWHNDRVSCI